MTSALSLCLGIFPLNLALYLVDDSGVVVASWVVWGWLFGKNLVGQGKEAFLGTRIMPTGSLAGSFRTQISYQLAMSLSQCT